MWTFFKIINFIWLLASTRMWLTTYFDMLPVLAMVNILMVVSIGMLPIKIEFSKKTGLILLAITAIVAWESWCDSYKVGLFTLLSYLPAMYLTFLPVSYLKDLLKSNTTWFAIMLVPALLLYWVLLFVHLPSFGKFIHPVYVPFDNYLFYLKTTWDNGILTRFNAFFLEPGHLALLCTFLLVANRFRVKEFKWLWVLLVSVAFSFSLAGYLLTFMGFVLLKIDSILKGILAVALTIAVVVGLQSFLGEDSSINKLILERIERDESQGIKGNNRFSGNTDFVFERSVKSGDVWFGVSDKVNMKLVNGAGYKIYLVQYGIVGALLALLVYITLIPPHPDYRYSVVFIVILMMCFMQRSYPGWWSWLFPYVAGSYVAADEKRKVKELGLNSGL